MLRTDVRISISISVLSLACACGSHSVSPREQGEAPAAFVNASDTSTSSSLVGIDATEALPVHLQNFPGIFVRDGDRIFDAPAADVAVARAYPRSPTKGSWVAQRRISILSAQRQVRAGEPVRIIHVSETIREGDELFVMGPKKVLGEFVDGLLRTPPAPAKQDPLRPWITDGRSLPAPAVDYNWSVTEYTFAVPGRHTIEWKLGDLVSNPLHVEVVR